MSDTPVRAPLAVVQQDCRCALIAHETVKKYSFNMRKSTWNDICCRKVRASYMDRALRVASRRKTAFHRGK